TTSYEGQWAHDLQNGYGVEKWADGSQYAGIFENGHKKLGVYTWNDGGTYRGQWEDSEIQGLGHYKGANGRIFNGEWKKSFKVFGAHYYEGQIYEGSYKKDKKSGFGVFTWPDGKRY